MKRLGVIGTFVWDTIYPLDTAEPIVEEWGGITYALGALDAALPDDWGIVPVIQAGTDLIARAETFLSTIRHLTPDAALAPVPYPNNRVTLRYQSPDERREYLIGGVPAWEWDRLKPRLEDLDALYVNLISGMELDLSTMEEIRRDFTGPIYCDIHSLLLAVGDGGLRVPRKLPEADRWLACADFIQVNEDEMRRMARDADTLADMSLALGVISLLVTLGSRGVRYYVVPDLERSLDRRLAKKPRERSTSDAFDTSLVPARQLLPSDRADPTGCGDVWGATYFARLLAGDKFGDALAAAMTAAIKNVNFRGASGLANYLRGENTVK